MRNYLNTAVAGLVIMGTIAPTASFAAPVKHKMLKTVAAGVAGYELAKHSHNRFLQKHRFAAGVAGAMMMHSHLKKKSHQG